MNCRTKCLPFTSITIVVKYSTLYKLGLRQLYRNNFENNRQMNNTRIIGMKWT